MCGIFALIEQNKVNLDPEKAEDVFKSYKSTISSVYSELNHRGPDSKGNNLIIDPNFKKSVLMLHSRLKICGDDTTQPLVNNDNTIYLIINGEIFNWKELQKELNYTCTKSDCEIIFPLYEKYKNDLDTFFNKLNGQFSFFLYDLESQHVLIGRDRIGVTPLYIGINETENRFVVSSELKCLHKDLVTDIKVFPPRKYIYANVNIDSTNFTNFYCNYIDFNEKYKEITQFNENDLVKNKNIITEMIRTKLTNSVRLRLKDIVLNDQHEFGVLLSGGLDSSLIASLVVSLADEMGYTFNEDVVRRQGTKQIKTFSIGVDKDVPDLIAAREVASFLNTDHHEYYFSIKEGLDSLEDVVLYTETYDSTSIRASTPMYLLTKQIKQNFPNLKVLFSGELSDELLCYLYGANAPSEKDFQLETLKLVNNVHQFDCLRANKTCMANSIEVRVPFTDPDFVNSVLSLHPRWKSFGNVPNSFNKMEKQILRDSFKGYLPNSILYRKKEQFSDGVSGFNGKENNWIDALKDFSNNAFTDSQFNEISKTYTYNTPNTKEQLYYRILFHKIFKNIHESSQTTVHYWEPNWSDSKDPSGRVQTFWTKN
jgi:asparagine synthase (glutamine-hydrolysing)